MYPSTENSLPQSSSISAAPHIRSRRLPISLICFLLTSFALLAVSLLVAWHRSRHGNNTLGLETLYPGWIGFDYYDYISRFHHRHSVEFFTSNDFPAYPWYYPAPAIFVSYPFYRFAANGQGYNGYGVFQTAAVLLDVLLAAGLASSLYRRGLNAIRSILFPLAVLLLSWPLYFAVERGNIEALTWPLVALAVWAFTRQKDITAATLVGLAAAIKFYPALLLLLFIPRRNWKAIFWSVLVAVAVTVAALRYLEPDIVDAARRTWMGIDLWTRNYAEVFHQEYDHSAFCLIKRFTYTHHPRFRYELHRYYLVAAPIFALGIWKLRRLPLLNQVLFLICAMVTLPPASFDYTLCYLYIPIAWLSLLAVRADRDRFRVAVLTPVMVLLAVLTSPESFLNLHALNGNPGALKAACLLTLMTIAATIPLDVQNQRSPETSTVPSAARLVEA